LGVVGALLDDARGSILTAIAERITHCADVLGHRFDLVSGLDRALVDLTLYSLAQLVLSLAGQLGRSLLGLFSRRLLTRAVPRTGTAGCVVGHRFLLFLAWEMYGTPPSLENAPATAGG
jgi:hypothetical protein